LMISCCILAMIALNNCKHLSSPLFRRFLWQLVSHFLEATSKENILRGAQKEFW
jgi:hypothetical protein